MQTKDDSTLLTQRAVMAMVGIGSRETLARWMRRGQFPRPIKVGGGGLRWLPGDITAWLTACASVRDERTATLANARRQLTAPTSPRRTPRHG